MYFESSGSDGSLPQPSERETRHISYCGRTFCRCDCISPKTLFTISAIVGVVLLLIGALALLGYSAPTVGGGVLSPMLQKLNTALSFLATHLGTDPLILAAFPTAFGVALSFTGCVGLAINKKKPLIPESNEGAPV